MTTLRVGPAAGLRGRVRVPGDKSISHRALILASLAEGVSRVENWLPGGDCQATLRCLEQVGVQIRRTGSSLCVEGQGLYGLCPPARPLDCARSGTTMRLLAGFLAGQPFESVLTGSPGLNRRPMERVAQPLRAMGARVETTEGHGPIRVQGPPLPQRRLRGGTFALAVASAQVKSAILLAGLYADGPVTVSEPAASRDHTERLLRWIGVDLRVEDRAITLCPPPRLPPFHLRVPGDLSSAAFLLVAACLAPNSEVTVEGVGLNPTRTGLLDVLRTMGAEVEVASYETDGPEPIGTITARASHLDGVEIGGATVVRMIDEFPILAVAATQAHGRTVVRDAAELRVKESDRIAAVVRELRRLGARIQPLPDGFVVEGPCPLRGATVESHGDHRLAMALAIAGLVSQEPVAVRGAEWIEDSFPGFVECLRAIGVPDVEWSDEDGGIDRLADRA